MLFSVSSVSIFCKQFKWRHWVARYTTYASGSTWWTNLQLMQVAPLGGQIYKLCKRRHLLAKWLMRMAPSGSQFGNQYKWWHQVNKFSANADIFAVLAVPAVWASSPSSPALLTVLAVQAVLLLALLLCTYRIYRALWACSKWYVF